MCDAALSEGKYKIDSRISLLEKSHNLDKNKQPMDKGVAMICKLG